MKIIFQVYSFEVEESDIKIYGILIILILKEFWVILYKIEFCVVFWKIIQREKIRTSKWKKKSAQNKTIVLKYLKAETNLTPTTKKWNRKQNKTVEKDFCQHKTK